MKHPNWKETKEQRRMVRRIATDLAMEELYMQKKAEQSANGSLTSCCSSAGKRGRPRRTAGSVTMVRFSGLEIKPYSQLTELPRVRIDRVRVEVQRTLFGEVEYHLVGTYGDEGRAYPICQPFTELPDVWEKKKEVESAIFKARQEEQYARKRKDADYLETPARPV